MLPAAIAASVLALSGASGAAVQQTPKRGGTVVIGVPDSAEPACFNGLVPACLERGAVLVGEMWDLVLASAFEVGPGLTFRPDVVSHVNVRKKPFTLTYHIRPKARWSDGTPVTARDLDFTYRAIVSTPSLLPNDPIRRITRTEIVGARTFRVRVDSRLAVSAWKAWLLIPTPSHALSGLDRASFWRDTIDNPKTGEPIGSGPFLMQSRSRGRQITFVRNPAYWGRHRAYLDRLVFRFLPPSELAGALRDGRVDVILPFPGVEAAAQEIRMRRPPGTRVVTSFTPFWEHLAIRVGPGGHPSLESKLVRRAIAYGVDRIGLVRALEDRVFGTMTPRLTPLQSVFLPSENPHFEPNWQRFSYRPTLARRLLALAGCRATSDDVRVCGGERLSLRVGTTAGVERRELALEVIRAQLGRLGIEVRARYLPGVGALTRAFRDGDLDIALFSWEFSVNSLGSRFRCGGAENYTGHCSRLVTRELDNAGRVLDDASQAKALNRAERLLVQDVPVLPLFRAPTLVAFRAAIQNFEPDDILWNAEDWWLDE